MAQVVTTGQHGGRREGAGRKKGSHNRASVERQERIASTGQTPLDVLIEVMRFCRANLAMAQQNKEGKDVQRIWAMVTAKIAADAAPYVHPKLAAIQVSGDPDNPLVVVDKIERVIVNQIENLTNPDAENIPAAG